MNGLFNMGDDASTVAILSPARVLPDYRTGSIVNLMGSLIAGLGGASRGYAPLASLPPEEVAAYRQVVLIVVDGLGDDFLTRMGSNTQLGRYQRTRLTSVFPSTTAAAIPTFLTGLAPQQHGLTGWHMFFRELGAVLAVLPGKPRYGGTTLRQAGCDVGRFFGHRPVFDGLPVISQVLTPRHIAHSDFNLAHLGRAELTPFDHLRGFFAALAGALTRDQQRRFVYAYWSELDRIAHEAGCLGAATAQHFMDWDQSFGDFLIQVAGTDTLIIVTADHGFIDTDAPHTVDLAQHPALADCLSLPLCGEPRAAFAYVKPGRVRAFEDFVSSQLADVAELHRSEDLIEQGWFGQGDRHPRLADRIGDFALIMRENYVLRDWLPGERRYRQVGVHGGISPKEMWVPLLVVSA